MATITHPVLTDAANAPSAASLGLTACHSCRLLCRTKTPGAEPKDQWRCPRCGAVLHPRKPHSVARTWALMLAALILYVPANVLPITHTAYLGNVQSDTILSGVIFFMINGSWHIALIIFTASVMVPILKLVILAYLLLSIQFRFKWRPEDRTRLYRFTEIVGRWSMVDIFVVTVLVAMVKLGFLASVEAGPGAVYFGAVVVLTMLAANSLDPRLIWDAREKMP
jgi:paraquat-inducible protein A